jgi:prefoldin alpha subunit
MTDEQAIQPDEQVMQQKYQEFQFLAQHIEQFQQQLQVIQQQLQELSILSDQLQELSTVKKASKMWASIGGGIYIPSETVEDCDKVLMNVGSGTYVKKELKDAKDLVDGQLKELETISTNHEAELDNLKEKMTEIQSFFQE